MVTLPALLLLYTPLTVLAAFCKKEFFYHQHYSYGYDIYCNNLDHESMPELTETVVYNEIKLTIEHSSFKNTSWHIAKHLPRLREVKLRFCQLDNPSIFRGLKRLALLNVEHTGFERIGSGYFDGLDDLQELVLRNNSLRNSIFDEFTHLETLVTLNLNWNSLEGVFDAENCTLYNLKQIYLQHNNISGLGNISCLSYIEEMYLDFNSITDVNHIDALVNLKVLSLNHNRIEKLTLHDLKRLEVLNLENNKVSILSEDSLYNLRNLKRLSLKNNYIHIISDRFLSNVKHLKYLNLGNNSIDEINLKYLLSIEELNLSNNRLSSLKIFSDCTSLRRLDVSRNDIREIEQYIFSKLSNVTVLNMSHNLIGDNIYDASFFGLASLTNLQFENTSTSYIPESAFIFIGGLQVLNLSGNKMKEFGKLFDRLINLRALNISYNTLEELRYDTIKDLVNLETIDVEGNLLRNVEYDSIVKYLHKLVAINVKNNTLSCEFLTKMIKFFSNNHVNYTINEDFNYDKENVAGIYCKEYKNKFVNDTLHEASVILEDNTVLLKQLVNLTENSSNEYSKRLVRSVTYATISVVLISIFLTFVSYRTYVYLKRRHYCSDEFELIGPNKY